MLAPADVASALFRLDQVGVLLPATHQLAGRPSVPVEMLSGEPLLLSPEARAARHLGRRRGNRRVS